MDCQKINLGSVCSVTEKCFEKVCHTVHHTHLFSLLEGDLSLGCEGQQVLEAVDNAVWYGGHSGVANGQGH